MYIIKGKRKHEGGRRTFQPASTVLILLYLVEGAKGVEGWQRLLDDDIEVRRELDVVYLPHANATASVACSTSL